MTNTDWKTLFTEYRKDPVRFLREQYFLKRNKPIVFEDWQVDEILTPLLCTKNVHGAPVAGHSPCPCGSGARFGACCTAQYDRWYNEAVIGLPKKNGKSELAAAIAFAELFLGQQPEIYFISNSMEQTTSLSYRRLRKAVENNDALGALVKAGSTKMTCDATDGTVRILPCRASSVAGVNPSLVHFDELWGFVHDESEAVFAELTLSPARTESLNVVTSYAGFRRSGPLWEMYTRGRSGTDSRMFFRWYTENKASWVKPEYLEQQRRRLPEPVYKRLHENQWSAGGGFLSGKMIDDAVDRGLKYGVLRGGTIGLDIGLRKDRTAMARVVSAPDGTRRLADLHMWQGSADAEVCIEEVETALLCQFETRGAAQCLCDPWQFAGSRQRLQKKINIREYAFSAGGVRQLAAVLFDAFRSRRIRIPDDPELVEELRNLQLVETTGGWRFDHSGGGHDDRAVAIALALAGELERPVSRPLEEILDDMKSTGRRRAVREEPDDESVASPEDLIESYDEMGRW